MSVLNIALAAEQCWVASYKQDLEYYEQACECMHQRQLHVYRIFRSSGLLAHMTHWCNLAPMLNSVILM